jgi:integrase
MENMAYHAFRKPKKLKNGKTVHRWYYYYIDSSGKQIQKSCGKSIRTHQAAEDYIRTLPAPPPQRTSAEDAPPFQIENSYRAPTKMRNNTDMLVREIAENMFIPGSDHVLRRKQLNKSVSLEVLGEMRVYIRYILKTWGDRMLKSLELDEVMNYLFSVKHSGSWKNRYISALKEIYQEAQFLGCKIYKPDFPSIRPDYKKADIFTDAELERLFRPENFPNKMLFLFFLTSLSGGLRLGETQALRVKQIIFDSRAIIVDGFLKKNGIRTTYNKKGSPEHPKLRVVPYPSVTLAMLRRRIEQNGLWEEDYLFTYEDGVPIKKSHAASMFTRAMVKAGITPDVETMKKNGNWIDGSIQRHRGLMPDGRRLVPHSLRYNYITNSRNVMRNCLLNFFWKIIIDY